MKGIRSTSKQLAVRDATSTAPVLGSADDHNIYRSSVDTRGKGSHKDKNNKSSTVQTTKRNVVKPTRVNPHSQTNHPDLVSCDQYTRKDNKFNNYKLEQDLYLNAKQYYVKGKKKTCLMSRRRDRKYSSTVAFLSGSHGEWTTTDDIEAIHHILIVFCLLTSLSYSSELPMFFRSVVLMSICYIIHKFTPFYLHDRRPILAFIGYLLWDTVVRSNLWIWDFLALIIVYMYLQRHNLMHKYVNHFLKCFILYYAYRYLLLVLFTLFSWLIYMFSDVQNIHFTIVFLLCTYNLSSLLIHRVHIGIFDNIISVVKIFFAHTQLNGANGEATNSDDMRRANLNNRGAARRGGNQYGPPLNDDQRARLIFLTNQLNTAVQRRDHAINIADHQARVENEELITDLNDQIQDLRRLRVYDDDTVNIFDNASNISSSDTSSGSQFDLELEDKVIFKLDINYLFVHIIIVLYLYLLRFYTRFYRWILGLFNIQFNQDPDLFIDRGVQYLRDLTLNNRFNHRNLFSGFDDDEWKMNFELMDRDWFNHVTYTHAVIGYTHHKITTISNYVIKDCFKKMGISKVNQHTHGNLSFLLREHLAPLQEHFGIERAQKVFSDSIGYYLQLCENDHVHKVGYITNVSEYMKETY